VNIWGKPAENFAMLAYRGRDIFVEDLAPSGEIKRRFQPSQKSVARSVRHQVVKSEGHEENEGNVNEFGARSRKTKAK
jgi:hypothetical protein